MSAPRGLTDEEKAAWQKLAATVRPLDGEPRPKTVPGALPPETARQPQPRRKPVQPAPPPSPRSPVALRHVPQEPGLDSHWDRRLKSGSVVPDFTLDLHGHTLDSAHARLDSGLAQAKAMGARLVLLVAGKPRPADPADRGERRGAIRAKILDWLAAGPHGQDVAAIRKAHRRHGGEGALYLVLKRRR